MQPHPRMGHQFLNPTSDVYRIRRQLNMLLYRIQMNNFQFTRRSLLQIHKTQQALIQNMRENERHKVYV